MSDGPSRRALMLGATGALLTGCASSPAADARRAGTRVDGSFASVSMGGADVGWTIVYPRGHERGARLPVVVTLHGRGASHATALTSLHLDSALDEVVAGGVRPFAVASVDGGDHGYWHRRADGTDSGAMVADELVPLLRSHGLDTARLGLHGWSMGGYGALLLAGRHRVAVRAVAVASPALFTSAGATPQGAFDSAQDFTRNDVNGHPGWLDGVALRIDCGRDDPFYPATRRFVDELRDPPAGGFGRGAHTPAYWRSVAPAELAFLGRRL